MMRRLVVMARVLRRFGEVYFPRLMLVEAGVHPALQQLGLAAGRQHVTRFEREKSRE